MSIGPDRGSDVAFEAMSLFLMLWTLFFILLSQQGILRRLEVLAGE